MGNPAYFHRLQELKHFAECNDLNQGTRRVLDFCLDFEIPDPQYSAALQLREKFNLNSGPKGREEFDQLFSLGLEMHRLLEELENYGEEKFGRYEAPPEVASEATEPMHRLREEDAESMESSEKSIFAGKNICKRYRLGAQAFELKMNSLVLNQGEITGVVGENGNGKTTILRIVAGDLAVSSGELSFPFLRQKELRWEEAKQNIAYIPQRLPRWFGSLRDNLQFSASVHGIKGRQNRENTRYILHRLGLSRYEEATWKEISSGYKLRFELARALVWHPKLLVLDEPLANLDLNTRDMFLQDLRHLADSLKHPVSIIISSQQLQEVEEISDNIVFLSNGKPLYNGKMKDFGKERAENLFEFASDATLEQLKLILSDIEGLSLEDKGKVFVLRSPLEFRSPHLLGILSEKEIEVSYFREISNSTRKLFRQAHA